MRSEYTDVVHVVVVLRAAFDCAGDSVDDFNMLIPIIVGAILALLIVIVLVAYCIGRSRISKANEYSTI